MSEQISTFLASKGEAAMTWAEAHGLICAVVAGPGVPENWQQMVLDDEPLPEEQAAALERLRQHMESRIVMGDAIALPCRLDPEEDRDGNDLTGWCTGFMTGVFLQEAAWYEHDEDRVAELLLGILLISGLDEDPVLEELWNDRKLVRQMARGIPDIIEELYLLFHAPDMPAS